MGEMEQAQPAYFSATKIYQYIAAGAATLGAFGLGTCLAWTSPALPDLATTDKFRDLKPEEVSWIGAMVPLGALVSGPVTGYLIGKIGRKTTMMGMGAPFVLGWLLLILAQNYPMLLAGRFITGFCGGSFSISSPVYIGELAEGSIRGILGSGFQMMVVLGILFVYCVGAVVSWVWVSVMCAFVPALLVICMMFMPESPRYLVAVGKRAEAAKALAWFRGSKNTSDVNEELQAMQLSVEEQLRNQASFKDLLHPSLMKPTLISLLLMLFQQLSGVNAVIFFVEQIFIDAGSEIKPELSSIIVGIVQVVATLASMFLVDRLGRRILLIFSDAVMAASLVLLGIFFLIKDNQESDHWSETIGSTTEAWKAPVAESFGWLPLISLMLFITSFSLGFGPIPWMLLGEILPPRAIGLASSISASFNWTLAFFVTKFFESLKDAITIQWAYFSFAIICGIGTVYVILIVPETKGKSLDEIQAMFGETQTIVNNTTPRPGLVTNVDSDKGRSNPGFEKEEL